MWLKLFRLSDKRQRKLLEYFVLEVTVHAPANLMEIQANTAVPFYRKVQMIIAEKLETEAFKFTGEIELEESYFGVVRKGKRGRGAAGKVPDFSI